MYKKVLVVTFAALALPVLALAAQPLLVRFDGHRVPVRETVRVERTAWGPVSVRTWSWSGPNGAATFQVSESRSASSAAPAWALAQMRALQRQVRQMRLIQAAVDRAFLAPPPVIQAVLGRPLPLPAGALPSEVRILRPWIALQPQWVPVRIIAVVPAPSAAHVAPRSPLPRHLPRHGRLI
jgi:hypothetical protein